MYLKTCVKKTINIYLFIRSHSSAGMAVYRGFYNKFSASWGASFFQNRVDRFSLFVRLLYLNQARNRVDFFRGLWRFVHVHLNEQSTHYWLDAIHYICTLMRFLVFFLLATRFLFNWVMLVMLGRAGSLESSSSIFSAALFFDIFLPFPSPSAIKLPTRHEVTNTFICGGPWSKITNMHFSTIIWSIFLYFLAENFKNDVQVPF